MIARSTTFLFFAASSLSVGVVDSASTSARNRIGRTLARSAKEQNSANHFSDTTISNDDNDEDATVSPVVVLSRSTNTSSTTATKDFGYWKITSSSSGGGGTHKRTLCLTALNDKNDVGLAPCQESEYDDSTFYIPQLWRMDEQGRMRSALNTERCLSVPHLGYHVKVRLGPCLSEESHHNTYNRFVYRHQTEGGGQLELLREVDNTQYLCLTHQGIHANAGDTLHLKSCESNTDTSSRFQWTIIVAANVPWEAYPLVIVHSDGGHIIVRDYDVTKNGNRIVLGSLSGNDGNQWWIDGYGLFHSTLDVNKCLQAGWGGDDGKVKDGTALRIMDCDPQNDLQRFEWDLWGGPIRLQNNAADLCVTYRGVVANVGKDPIILKYCGGSSDGVLDERFRWYED